MAPPPGENPGSATAYRTRKIPNSAITKLFEISLQSIASASGMTKLTSLNLELVNFLMKRCQVSSLAKSLTVANPWGAEARPLSIFLPFSCSFWQKLVSIDGLCFVGHELSVLFFEGRGELLIRSNEQV